MRFDAVIASAFGPFTDESLEFAPGLNVIWGPNEAGKSSWHAALYAGLCGMRRARGKPTSDDQRFADRHRPWDGDRWEVGTLIRLEDGRCMELRHDLAGRVKSRATDRMLGRDCSDEIINDGTPDGSRWLGLDRRAFLATACIRQGDLLGVLSDPALLQEYLQRAADSGGADSTVAAALTRLERFRAEQVGSSRAGSVRPLRRAQEQVDAARESRDGAARAHAEYLRLSAEIQELSRALPGPDPGSDASPVQVDQIRDLETRLSLIEHELAKPIESPPRAGLVLGGLLLALGIGLLVGQSVFLGTIGTACGALLLGWWVGQRRREQATKAQQDALVQEHARLHAELEERQRQGHAAQATQDERASRALRLAELNGQRDQLTRMAPSVAEAEERLLAAEAEVARLQELDRVLTLTQSYLTLAQERVHRTIAPRLTESIRARIARIAGGRYLDARVDPATLELRVQERAGAWRDAALLSHGTAEQLYLLLRMALVAHLTRPGEICPLIVDDITVHFDDARAGAVLETLQQLSLERQVLLFSQESRVRAWAERAMRDDAGARLIVLSE